MAVITLLTDFGLTDSYVAEVKAVVLSRIPSAQLVDITHDVPPGNIPAAQYLLRRCWRLFPAGTIHFAVVDPGVGTSRRAIAAERDGHRFVAPDNGLLTAILDGASVVALSGPAAASATFHGRDIFAPAAVRLAQGATLAELGPPVTDPVSMPLPEPVRSDGQITGTVIHVDRFGTLVTNVPAAWIKPATVTGFVIRGITAPLRRTFGDVSPGDFVAFPGSGETIEIALRDGSAAARLDARVGTVVEGR